VRPYSAGVRLGAAAAHALLGAAPAAARHVGRLDVKHVQLDSVASHHLLPPLRGLAGPADAALTRLLADTDALFDDHRADAAEAIMSAYRQGSFTKVLEFSAFAERLAASHSRAVARAERALAGVSRAWAAREDVGAALAAACARLPLAECPPAPEAAPAAGAAGAAAPAGAPRRMRFNQDLTTRPAWYPPSGAAAGLAVADWWQARSAPGAAAPPLSTARCWWGAPGAAECARPEAQAWRRDAQAAAARQWLLPHLLRAATAAASGAGAGASAADTQQLAAQLLATHGAGAGDAWLPARIAAAAGRGAELAALLPAAMAATAAALAPLLAGASGADVAGAVEAGEGVQQRCDWLATVLCGAASAAAGALAAAGVGSAAHGGAVNLAAALATQHAAWLGLCLEAWLPAARAGRRRQAKGDAPGSGAAALSSALAALQAALAAACQALAFAARSYTAEPAEERAGALLSLAAADGAEGLWSWRADLDARALLRQVLEEQAAALAPVAALGGADAQKRLAALALQ
jgi:N-terminal acetyltransferase B complex non-catalytic subunit